MAFFLNLMSSGAFLFSFRLMSAGVLIILELEEDASKTVFFTPGVAIVSIELTNLAAINPVFLLIV